MKAMVDRLIEKSGPAVQLDREPQSKGERTRARIMDLAYESIVEKGFAATSIEELVEAAGITKSGFFYHFKDKNDLARQLFERFLDEDEGIIDTLEKRASELSDDPLQSFLIFLNLYAQMMDDMETLASRLHGRVDHLSGADVRRRGEADERRLSAKRMRERFVRWIEEIVGANIRRAPRSMPRTLADQLNVIVEGAIIHVQGAEGPGADGAADAAYRKHMKLLFGA